MGVGWGIEREHVPEGWGVKLHTHVHVRSRFCCHDTQIMEKTVLLQLQTSSGSRNRPVSFIGGKKELLSATKAKFSDVLSKDGELFLQIRDESWGEDVFVDLMDEDIPERAMVKAVEIKKVSCRVSCANA